MATLYWAAHGASLVIILVFSRLCRKTITRGKEDTRSGTKKRFMPWAWIVYELWICFGFCPSPPPPQPPSKIKWSAINIHFESSLRIIEFTAHAWYFGLSTSREACGDLSISYLYFFRSCLLLIHRYIYRCTLVHFPLHGRFLHWDMDWNHKLGNFKDWQYTVK